jgi:peptidoglycan/xylan/chitin deacetylase (PgdA/CDA1 family)
MAIRWPAGAEAALTLSFDDGYAATFGATVFSLRQRGLCGTYHVVTGRTGARLGGLATADWAQWREAARLGHEIGSHGTSHAPAAGPLSDARRLVANLHAAPDRRAYIRQLLATARALSRWRDVASPLTNGQPALPLVSALTSSRQCIDREVGSTPESFAYPAGRHSAAARGAVAAAGFRSARTLDLGLNHASTDSLALHSVALAPGMAVEDLAAWCDRARTAHGWLIVVFHLVGDRGLGGYPYFCSSSDWQRFLDASQARPMWIATQRDVVRHLSAVVTDESGTGG